MWAARGQPPREMVAGLARHTQMATGNQYSGGDPAIPARKFLDCGLFERLNRYETALWRQAVQTLIVLQSIQLR